MRRVVLLAATIGMFFTLSTAGFTGTAFAVTIKEGSTWTTEVSQAPAGDPKCERINFFHQKMDGHKQFESDHGEDGRWSLSHGVLDMQWEGDNPYSFEGTYLKKNREFQGKFTYGGAVADGVIVKGDAGC
jgi:hypothetical protein